MFADLIISVIQLDGLVEIIEALRVEIFLFVLGIAFYHLSKPRLCLPAKSAKKVCDDRYTQHSARTREQKVTPKSRGSPRSADLAQLYIEIDDLSARGLHDDVVQAFEKLPDKNVVLSKSVDYSVVLAALHCNRDDIACIVLRLSSSESNRPTMIRTLARSGDFDRAMHLFGLLEKVGGLNAMACNAALDACVESGNLAKAVEFMKRIESAGLVDTVTYNTLIKVYLRKDSFSQARKLVSEMHQRGLKPNTVTYNELINAAARSSNNYQHSQVWELFEEMKRDGIIPSGYTFSVLLKNWTSKSAQHDLEAILECIENMEEPMDDVLLSSIIEACVRGKRTAVLSQWLKKLGDDFGGVKITGSHVLGSLIKGYGLVGDLDNVWRVWREMHSRRIRPSSITIGCMVESIASNGDPDGAYELVMGLMDDSALRNMINSVIFGSVLKGYSHTSKIDRVMSVFREMQGLGIEPSAVTYNIVINSCARSKQMESMMALVDEMQTRGLEPNTITINTMIKGFCQAKAVPSAFALLDKMRKTTKFKPDEVLYTTLLDGCCKSGLIKEAEMVLEQMQTDGWTPTHFDLTNIVVAMGTARCLDRAFEIVANFTNRPNIHILSALLAACVQSRDFERALQLYRQKDGEFNNRACQGLVRGLLRNNKHRQAVELLKGPLQTTESDRRSRRPSPFDDAFISEVVTTLKSSSSADVVSLAASLRH